ncbi:MAG TPA: type II secretion system protein GspM [Acidobacteriota bacterium]|nr:type II secretion system protein GspM [Acidobacteriota bacterium]HQM62393.1 type II secretion system protein GspM [Acidobacteriota bacterium]
MNISRRDRRVILIGGVVVLLVAAVWYGILPLIEYARQLENDKNQLESDLIRKAEIIRQKDGYQQSLAGLMAAEDRFRSIMIEGTDPTQVTSELHRVVNTLAEQHGISVSRIDASLKPERFDTETVKQNPFMGNFLKLRVRASLKCTPDKLMAMLASIEGHPKFLAVERLEVRAWNVRPDKEINPDIVVMTLIFKPDESGSDKKKPSSQARLAGNSSGGRS